MAVLKSYWSTIEETRKKKEGSVLTVRMTNMNTVNTDSVHIGTSPDSPKFATPYMMDDYSIDNMDICIPIFEDWVYIPSALDYVLSGLPLERYCVNNDNGNHIDIEVIVIDVPKKIWKKHHEIVTDIAYKFATHFPDLTIIAAIPKDLKSENDILNIFSKK